MTVKVSHDEVLCELVEVMLAGGSDNLHALLGTEVVFSHARLVDADTVEMPNDGSVVVGVEFIESLEGETLLTLTPDEAKAIVLLMTAGMEIDEADLLGEMGLSAVGEAMNQLMAGFSTSLGSRIGEVVQISPPTIELINPDAEQSAPIDKTTVVTFDMSLGDTPHGSLHWRMSEEFATDLVSRVQPESSELETPQAQSIEAPANDPLPRGLGPLADLELTAVVELGRATLPMRTLLGMANGSVIRLGRNVEEPADLYVNGTLAAKGDIVLVDGKLGLRVSEVLTVTQGGN